MRTALQDLRFGFRTLRRNTTFTAVAVLSIALGIAVNATVFGWMESVLLNPLPGVERAGELVVIKSLAADGQAINASYPDVRDIREQARTLAGVTAFEQRSLFLGEPPRMERIWSQPVTGEFFDVLGVKALLGRTFSREEKEAGPGGAPVVVISERAWRSRFRSSPTLVGSTIKLNRQPFQVIGVVPADFLGALPGLRIDYWVPEVMESQLCGDRDVRWMEHRGTRPLNMLARLAPGVTAAEASAEVASIARRLAQEYPRTNETIGGVALPISQSPEGTPYLLGPILKILFAISGLVLLIVCANVGNLLLARATSRQKEFAIRMSLGASRGRLVRQLLTESLLLSLAGGALGVLGANWMYDTLRFVMPTTDLPAAVATRFDGLAVLFTIGLSILTTLLCGLAPAIQFSRDDVNARLRQSGRGNSGGRASARLRGWLVAGEVSMALVALVGAGLFLASFARARQVRPGFDAENVLLASVNISAAGCVGEECAVRLEQIRERLGRLPGVESVAVADHVPLGFAEGPWDHIQPQGYVPRTGENMLIHRILVGPGYFGTMRIPMVEGREFDSRDEAKGLPVAVVNETLAKRYFGSARAIGRKFDTWGQWVTVVGVSKDAKYQRMVEAPVPLFYVPLTQRPSPCLECYFTLRTRTAPETMVQPVERALVGMEGGLGLNGIIPMTEYIGASYFMERVAASFLTVLGGMSVLLALVGLYGVMAYAITQRTNEIGIRVAIGAAPGNVVKLVVGDGLRLAVPGVAVGLVLALAASRVASSLLYHVGAMDAGIFAGMCVLVLVLSVAVSYIPARRAARLDPMTALRQE